MRGRQIRTGARQLWNGYARWRLFVLKLGQID